MKLLALSLAALVAASGCAHTVFVQTIPAGAKVNVDGVQVGTTPCSVELHDGSVLVAAKAGYHPGVTTVAGSGTVTAIVTAGLVNEFPSNVSFRLVPDEEWPEPTTGKADVDFASSRPARAFCTNCGSKFEGDVKFCGACGAKR